MGLYRNPALGHRNCPACHVNLSGDLTCVWAGGQGPFPDWHPARGDAVSSIIREQASSTRNRALGMVRIGMTQGHVQELGVSIRTIGRWVSRDRAGQPLENNIGRGRKSSVSRLTIIVIPKSVVNRRGYWLGG